MTITLYQCLVVSGLLFTLGLAGVLLRRNILIIYMALELMLNAVNLSLVAFSKFNGNIGGQILVFFVITVAAAEVAVGLAMMIALYRLRQTVRVDDLKAMKF